MSGQIKHLPTDHCCVFLTVAIGSKPRSFYIATPLDAKVVDPCVVTDAERAAQKA